MEGQSTGGDSNKEEEIDDAGIAKPRASPSSKQRKQAWARIEQYLRDMKPYDFQTWWPHCSTPWLPYFPWSRHQAGNGAY